jgi:hypothetical protein
MQKPVGGLSSAQKTVGGRVAIGGKQAQKHVEKLPQTRTYLEPISGSMQKPIEGRSATLLSELYKETINREAIVFSTR